jgi:hypothetical protein
MPKEILMPAKSWSAKRERQYQHIKSGLLERGTRTDEAEEIAARTVNKVRAQQGESTQASPSSIDDLSPSRRGGLRSHRGAQGRTRRQLYQDARAKGIVGRSRMNKSQLERALKR